MSDLFGQVLVLGVVEVLIVVLGVILYGWIRRLPE